MATSVVRGRLAGYEEHHRSHAEVREPEAKQASRDRQQHPLGHRLAEQPGTAGAEGGADGELAAARPGSGHAQVRQVHAADQKDQADRGLQHPHRSTGVPHDCVLQPFQLERVVLRPRRIPGRDVSFGPGPFTPVPEERLQFRPGCFGRHVVLQPADDIEHVTGSDLTNHGMHPERQPDLGAAVHEINAGWHDADDVVRPAIDVHSRSQDRPSCERALPQLIRQNRERRSAQARTFGHRVGFARREQASVRRLDSQRVQKMLVDGCRTHAQRAIAGRDVDFTAPRAGASANRSTASRECADMDKGSIYLAELDVLRVGEPCRRRAGDWNMPGQSHQLLRAGIVERSQDDAVENREDRRVCPDSQRQRHQRDRGEARTPPQAAQAITHVAPQVVEPRQAPLVAKRIQRLHGAAGPEPCRTRRFGRWDSTPPGVFGGHLQVQLQFVFQVGI